MAIDDNPYPLDGVGVSYAPDAPGVYALYLRDELVYYGLAEQSLRGCLQVHNDVELARFNRRDALTGFTFECPPDPERRRRQLVFQFVASRGQLPRRNLEETRERARAAEGAQRA